MNKRMAVAVVALLLAGAAATAASPDALTLKDVIEMALRNSGQIAVAKVRADVARGETRLDRSAFLPNLYTGTGAAYTYGFPSLPGGAAPSVFNLAFDEKLFDPPRRGEVKAAQDRTEEQTIAIEAARDQVIVRVATDYLRIAEIRQSLDLLRQEQQSAKNVLDLTQQRVSAGLELPTDVTEAQLTAAKIEQKLITLEGEEDVSEEDLRTATGMSDSAPLELAEPKLPPETDLPTPQLVTLALAHSPELREQVMEREARRAELGGQRGGYWPTVDLVGQYLVLSRFNNYDQYYRTFQRNSLNLGLAVQIPLFQSKTSSSIALAGSQFLEAQMDLDNGRRALTLQVKREAHACRQQDAGREVARLELQLAQQKLQTVQTQFTGGKATLVAVEQARLDENEKWQGYLQTILDAQKAQLELMQTTGQLTELLQ